MDHRETLLRAAYAAYNARDVAAILRSMSPQVAWPDLLEGGEVHGLEALRDYWKRQWAVIDPHLEPKHFATDENGDVVVALLQTVKGLDGTIISQGLVRHVYAFEKGLVQRMQVLH